MVDGAAANNVGMSTSAEMKLTSVPSEKFAVHMYIARGLFVRWLLINEQLTVKHE